MTVSRCPQRCHDPNCRVCGGGGYVWGDGSPATPEQMLEQITRMRDALPTRQLRSTARYRRGR